MAVGLDVKIPEKKCHDKHCVFHNGLSIRGRTFEGKVTRLNKKRTMTIEFARLEYLPKYERYEKKRTRLHAHLPDCITVNLGDHVKIVECRPISKTKNFTIVEVLK